MSLVEEHASSEMEHKIQTDYSSNLFPHFNLYILSRPHSHTQTQATVTIECWALGNGESSGAGDAAKTIASFEFVLVRMCRSLCVILSLSFFSCILSTLYVLTILPLLYVIAVRYLFAVREIERERWFVVMLVGNNVLYSLSSNSYSFHPIP